MSCFLPSPKIRPATTNTVADSLKANLKRNGMVKKLFSLKRVPWILIKWLRFGALYTRIWRSGWSTQMRWEFNQYFLFYCGFQKDRKATRDLPVIRANKAIILFAVSWVHFGPNFCWSFFHEKFAVCSVPEIPVGARSGGFSLSLPSSTRGTQWFHWSLYMVFSPIGCIFMDPTGQDRQTRASPLSARDFLKQQLQFPNIDGVTMR